VRVAHLSFAFSEYVIRLATALAEDIEVGVWLAEGDSRSHRKRLGDGVDVHVFDRPRMRQPHRHGSMVRQLLTEIRDYRPDIIHMQQGYLWFNPFLRFLPDVPLIITVHDPVPHVGDRNGYKTPQFITDLGFRAADRLIAHNEQMRDVLVGRGYARDLISVAPTVVRGDAELSTDQTDDGSTILFFGRIWPYKGLDYLIAAQPRINERIPGARFVIAGTGEDFEKYRGQMVDRERFEVHNRFVTTAETADLFAAASVVVLPYIDATQSGVIATAYNFGKPVVATTVGGLPAMVEDGVTGFLVPPRDEEALASAVIRVLSDDDLRARMSIAARRKAESEYAPSAVAERTLAIYRLALDNP
jgi:glycosyltransferase involved in cell wall biosynthesis